MKNDEDPANDEDPNSKYEAEILPTSEWTGRGVKNVAVLDYWDELEDEFYDQAESFYFKRMIKDKELAYRNNLYLIPLVLEPYNKGLASCPLLDWKTFGEEDSDSKKKKKDTLLKTIAEYAISENDEGMMEMPSFAIANWPVENQAHKITGRFYDYGVASDGVKEKFCYKIPFDLYTKKRRNEGGTVFIGLNNHNGTDITTGGNEFTSEIVAATGGTIIAHGELWLTGRVGTGYPGFSIVVDVGNGIMIHYAHMSLSYELKLEREKKHANATTEAEESTMPVKVTCIYKAGKLIRVEEEGQNDIVIAKLATDGEKEELRDLYPLVGYEVTAGKPIGRSAAKGKLGDMSPHLHFEIRYLGTAETPEFFLNPEYYFKNSKIPFTY